MDHSEHLLRMPPAEGLPQGAVHAQPVTVVEEVGPTDLVFPREQRPQLLGALGSDDVCCNLRAYIVEEGKPDRDFSRICIRDLVAQIRPGSSAEGLCRSMRSLADGTDFMLRVGCQGIWLRTDFIRAFVERCRAVFIDCGNSKTFELFLEEFLESTKKRSKEYENSFECWVVECVICAAVTLYSLRLQMVKPVVENILKSTRMDGVNSSLRLYPLKIALTSCIEQLRPLETGLSRAVHISGEDELDEWGSRRLGFSTLTSDGNQRGNLCPYLEEALDNWAHNTEDMMADAVSLSRKIDDTMRFQEASMSCTRNRLLTLELWTMVSTVATGVGTLISGIFGMNLDNYGYNNASGQFFVVTGLCFLLMAAIAIALVAMIVGSRNHYLKHAQEFGNNKFFSRIDDDEYVLELSESLPNGQEAKLAKLLSELRLPVDNVSTNNLHRSPSQRRRWAQRYSDPTRHGQVPTMSHATTY